MGGVLRGDPALAAGPPRCPTSGTSSAKPSAYSFGWWPVVGGWFVVREKYCWLVADKPSEQGVYSATVRARWSWGPAPSPPASAPCSRWRGRRREIVPGTRDGIVTKLRDEGLVCPLPWAVGVVRARCGRRQRRRRRRTWTRMCSGLCTWATGRPRLHNIEFKYSYYLIYLNNHARKFLWLSTPYLQFWDTVCNVNYRWYFFKVIGTNRLPSTAQLYITTRNARGVAANSQWVGLFFFAWVELWCIFIILTIVAFLYGIFWLDIMPVRWSYVRVVFVLRRPSILTVRVTFVRVLAFSYQFCYELRFSLQFSSYDIHCESSRFSIFWEGGLLCNLYAWQHKNFNSEHVGY
jgi:hypothetical protein